MISAGLNKLSLQQIKIRSDGTGRLVEEKDIRHLTELQTENCGLIEFRKIQANTSIRRFLQKINELLDKQDQQSEVIKILY